MHSAGMWGSKFGSTRNEKKQQNAMIVLEGFVFLTVVIGLALAARQFLLAWRVALGPDDHSRKQSGRTVKEGEWPTVTVLIPAHNEERVLSGCLSVMSALDYPADKLEILVVDDRSTDGTGTIADSFAARDERIRVLHRPQSAPPGKAAAVADGMALSTSEVVVLFDADYLPSAGLLKELVAPFADPSVGATMGRVVPANCDANLLTRLLDLERRAGYAVDQTGRALWQLMPQFGGTVGGIRRSALESVGGWRLGHLAEDTDLTFRLALGGWRVAYLNQARCHEEVPEEWASRFRQVRRWAYGHNQCLLSHLSGVLRSPRLRPARKLDGALILIFYLFPLCALLSILAMVPLIAFGAATSNEEVHWDWLDLLLAIAVLAPHTQVMVAARADRQRHIVRVLPLLFVSSSLSLLASAAGAALLACSRVSGVAFGWDKTRRYRSA